MWRRLRTIAWTALTLFTLMAAVLVGIGKLLMPYSEHYQPQLEAWMSREFNQPVRIDSFTGEWKAFGPRISLEGLNLLGRDGEAGVIAIERAALDIKPLNVLLAGRPLYSFRIIGADLALVRDADGHFELSGFGVSGRDDETDGAGGLNRLARLGEVVLEQGRLSFDDEQRRVHLRLVNVNGRLRMDGRDLAVQVEAGVSDSGEQRVLGDLGATVVARLDRQQRLSRLQWHVETGEMALAEIAALWPDQRLVPESGWLNTDLWGSWERDQPQRVEGVLDIRDASLETATGSLRLDHLNTRFRWRFSDRRVWRIDLSDVRVEEGGRQWSTPRLSVERNIPGGLGAWVSADFLEVGMPLHLTQHLMGLFNARWPKNAPRAGSGQVRDFHMLIDANRQFAGAGGEFENLAITDWGRWPGIYGLAGSASMASGEGDIRFHGKAVTVEWEGNFRAPATIDIPDCLLEVLWSDEWLVDARQCTVENEAIHLQGRTRFSGRRGVAGKPAVDINVAIKHARIAELDDFWPARVIKPNVSDWLNRALQGGIVRSGRFVLQGDLDEFPFRGGEGTLEAVLPMEDATLEFHPLWPAANRVNAMVKFQGAGMEVSGSIGDIGGVADVLATARIGDFQSPRLELDYAANADLAALAGFIRMSPLLENTRFDLGRYQFGGRSHTSGELSLPLGRTPGSLTVSGRLDLDGNQFTMTDAAFGLEGLKGSINYDRDGFEASALEATMDERATRLALRAEWAASELFSARLEGRFPVTSIAAGSALRDDPLLQRMSGDADWLANLSVTRSGDGESLETWLRLESDLVGTAMDLPAPLAKPAEESWPLRLDYPIEAAQPVFRVSLQDRADLQVVTGGGLARPRSATLQLGSGAGILPAEGLFTVAGQSATLNLDGWMDIVTDYLTADRQPGNLVFDSATVQADSLTLLNRSFANVAVTADYREQVLSAQFAGESITGTVRYNRTQGQAHSLAADFEKLYLPTPIDRGVTMDTNPARLPEMHLYVRDFRFLDIHLGETRIEAFPQGNGLRIDSVEAITEQMNFQARGDWLAVEGGYRSDFDIVLTAESLGALVEAMNLSSVIEGGQTMVRYDASWPGPPAAFAMAVLNGEMQFNVIDGRILNADPGAGRVLGLISVAALPRRLALDFRDVFESGFGFDQAHGTVKLENGLARTNDFVLESTAATLSINGVSDLVGKTFDYEMSVRPGVSQALPVIGAIAGGPGGAAAGLALQGLLREALGDATEARYRITGPWSEPEVIRIDVTATNPERPREAGRSEEPESSE